MPVKQSTTKRRGSLLFQLPQFTDMTFYRAGVLATVDLLKAGADGPPKCDIEIDRQALQQRNVQAERAGNVLRQRSNAK